MLFAGADRSRVADGSLTLAFRAWAAPRVVAGRTYRTNAGRIVVEEVAVTDVAHLTEDDAHAAGRSDLASCSPTSSRSGPWTQATLHVIAANPGVVSTSLAAKLGRDRAPFKLDVRKLKALGLTESLDVGYRLSPRGRAFFDADVAG